MEIDRNQLIALVEEVLDSIPDPYFIENYHYVDTNNKGQHYCVYPFYKSRIPNWLSQLKELFNKVKKAPDGDLTEIINEIKSLAGSFPIEIDHDTFSAISTEPFSKDLDLLRNKIMIFCSSMKK
jgi:hypothetical protein